MESYYKAYHNVIRMLTARKYKAGKTSDLSYLNLSVAEFQALFEHIDSGSLDIKGIRDERRGKDVYVRFVSPSTDLSTAAKNMEGLNALLRPIASTFGIDIASKAKADDTNIKEFYSTCYPIIVYMGVPDKNNLYPDLPIEKKLNRNHIQFFPVQRLTFCLLDAACMPRSIRIIDDSEIGAKYGSSKLPSFVINDPVVKYFGAQPGDKFEIIRSTKDGGTSIVWRKVVATQAPPYTKK